MRDIKVEAIRCVTAIIVALIIAASIVLSFSIEVIRPPIGNEIILVNKLEKTVTSCAIMSLVTTCGPSSYAAY